MTSILISSLLLAGCFVPSLAGALVDPSDKSLSETQTDYNGPVLNLKRNYHSKRKSVGIFGAGWCTAWESRLDISAEHASFIFCGAGKKVSFSKHGARWEPSAPQYKLSGSASGYTLTLADRDSFDFNAKGALTRMVVGDKDIRLSYSGNHLSSVNTAGDALTLAYANGLVQKISNAQGESWTYVFEKNSLRKVLSQGKEVFNYEYDSYGRLLAIANANGDKVKQYKFDNQGVTEVKAGQCVETLSADCRGLCKRVEVQTRCAGKSDTTRIFDIAGASRYSQLSVKESSAGKLKTEHTWQNGYLTEIKTPERNAKYRYGKDGLLQSVETPKVSRISVSQRVAGHPYRVFVQDLTNNVKPKSFTLKWNKNELAGIDVGGRKIAMAEGPTGIKFAAQNFSLVIGSGKSSPLSGTWLGAPISPFSFAGDPALLNPKQMEISATAKSLLALKSTLEEL